MEEKPGRKPGEVCKIHCLIFKKGPTESDPQGKALDPAELITRTDMGRHPGEHGVDMCRYPSRPRVSFGKALEKKKLRTRDKKNNEPSKRACRHGPPLPQ